MKQNNVTAAREFLEAMADCKWKPAAPSRPAFCQYALIIMSPPKAGNVVRVAEAVLDIIAAERRPDTQKRIIGLLYRKLAEYQHQFSRNRLEPVFDLLLNAAGKKEFRDCAPQILEMGLNLAYSERISSSAN